MDEAKVIIAPGRLRPATERWSKYGLLAEFAWLDSERVAGGPTPQQWQSIQAQVMVPGDGAVTKSLLEYLGGVGRVTSTMLLWLRSATDDVTAGQLSAESFLQTTLPGDMRRSLLDVIEPHDLGVEELPQPLQGWNQFVIAAQDHRDLDGIDMGWTQRREAVAVHTIAALGRVLGARVPVPRQGADGSAQFVHAFSRVVTGGHDVRRQSHWYLDQELPRFDATSVQPADFGTPLHPDQMVEQALTWTRDAEDGGLRYTRPPPISVHQAKQKETSWSVEFWSAALDLLGLSSADSAVAERREVIDRIRQDIADRLEIKRKEEGEKPPALAWELVFRMATSIIDGGPVPRGYERPVSLKQQLVLAPEHVEPDRGYQTHQYPTSLFETMPELRWGGPPIPIAESAVSQLADVLQEAPPPIAAATPDTPDVPRLGHFRKVIDAMDMSMRQEQADQLRSTRLRDKASEDEGVESGPPRRLLDLLYREIVRDCLHAWRDGERWRQLAAADWGQTGSRKLWSRLTALVGLAVAVGACAFWNRQHVDINVQLVQAGNSAVPVGVGYGVAILAGAAIMLAALVRHAITRRRRVVDTALEIDLRQRLGHLAEMAYDSHSRLEHAMRIFGLWWVILRNTYRQDQAKTDDTDPDLPETPRSLAVAEPEIHINYANLLQAAGSTDIGWRSETVIDLAATSLSKYLDDETHVIATQAMARQQRSVGREKLAAVLFADMGTAEGPLFRVARDLETNAVRDEWRRRETARIAAGLKASLTDLDQVVVPVDHSALTPAIADSRTLEAFLKEVMGDAQIQPGTGQVEGGTDLSVTSSTYATTPIGNLVATDALVAASVHLALAPVPTSSESSRPGGARGTGPDDSSGPDDPSSRLTL